MNYFYFKEVKDGFIRLDEEESSHLQIVLRKKTGEIVYLLNGAGVKAQGFIHSSDKQGVLIKVDHSVIMPPNNIRGHIGIGVTKNIERLEWFLEKATELGIQQITPFISKHGERHKLRMDRLEKIIRTAGKQSGNPYFPKLNEMVALKKLIEGAVESQKFIAHLDPTCQDHLFDRITPQQDCLVLIGPEGDFGREEILLAQQHDFKSVHLGENRLRTETAGIYATQCILLKNKS